MEARYKAIQEMTCPDEIINRKPFSPFNFRVILMSALLQDRVWVVLSEIAKRGIYPLHASRLGLFRMPVDLTDLS